MRITNIAVCLRPWHWRLGWTAGDGPGEAIWWCGPVGVVVRSMES
ncbi:hypothetical protein [Roseospira goensis]|uniref:Uncharacterized protein n=1 Tax=Roseospira goensis TaxID=391922 RepID=A0A7W6WM55_9PROT|nr:hypothetical protein [Roseospira goensis]MBB4287730.1 hypothetical protein [Roseospira goensis]